MKLSPIVLKIRAGNTRFSNRVAGVAEMELAFRNTLKDNVAFVIQLSEKAAKNEYQSAINQILTETIGVIIALKNDTTQKDKTGIIANDAVFDARNEIFNALLGWQVPGTESLLSYGGGRLLDVKRSYLWYQLEFIAETRLQPQIDTGENELPWFDKLHADYLLAQSSQLPFSGTLPLADPDLEQLIDFTADLDAGGYARGFSPDFKLFTG